MKFTLLKNKQLIFFFKKALNIGCDFFYLADSFGNLRPNKIKKICLELKKNNIDLSKFGYHGHNNLNLALKMQKIRRKNLVYRHFNHWYGERCWQSFV